MTIVLKAILMTVLLFVCFVLGGPAVTQGPGPAYPPEPLGALGLSRIGHSVAEPPEERTMTLTVTGDLMVHAEQLQDAWDEDAKSHDFSHCFAHVQADLEDEDYCIGNLETVFGGAEIGYSDYPRFSTPDSFGEALRDAGFDLLTTGNNHCFDKDEAGLLRTLEVLDSLGLDHTGTFADQQTRDNVFIRELGGIRVAFLSFTYGCNGLGPPKDKPYMVNVISEKRIEEDFALARAARPDLIVALPHLGNEYETAPLDIFKYWIGLMVENGADVVLASHPHVLQPMELMRAATPGGGSKEAFVIYSLGNFISSQRVEPREAGIVLKLDFSMGPGCRPKLEQARFVPTWVQFKDTDQQYCVRVLPVADAIRDYDSGNALRLRQQDAARLRRVHSETTLMYLGAAVEPARMQREYVFYTRRK